MTLHQSLVAHLLEHAESQHEKTALVCGQHRISYGQLAVGAKSAAQWLSDVGVHRGDRVILAASSSPSFVYGYFGTHILGGIALPVDPQIVDSRLNYIVNQTAPAVVLLTRPYQSESIVSRHIDEIRHVASISLDLTPPDGNAIADILFTTGTTGRPKGVALTHRSIKAAAQNINQFIGNGADDVEVVPLPLSHSFGLGRMRCNVLAGGTMVLMNGFIPPGPLFHALQSYRATGFSFVPAGWAVLHKLTGDKIGECADHLRYIEIGSAPMPMEHKLRLMELLPGTRICMHYGLTEASRSAFIEFHDSSEFLTSVGRPTPNVGVAVVDDRGVPVPAGSPGEIVISGDTVMHSYWNDPEFTGATLKNGYFYTGDLGFFDESGRLYLSGRQSELINVGGLKVAPGDIDAALSRHPAVYECACLGVPDPNNLTGQAIKAFLVCQPVVATRPSDAELVMFLREKVQAHEIPTVFEWVEEIPKSGSGKVQRQMLKTSVEK